jgi:hypothetical protein
MLPSFSTHLVLSKPCITELQVKGTHLLVNALVARLHRDVAYLPVEQVLDCAMANV